MRISDWSSDVCSSDLGRADEGQPGGLDRVGEVGVLAEEAVAGMDRLRAGLFRDFQDRVAAQVAVLRPRAADRPSLRSEEHTSELQSLMRISYAVFCLKKQKTRQATSEHHISTGQ